MSKNPEGQFPVLQVAGLQYWLGEHSTCTPVTPAAEHNPCKGRPGLALALAGSFNGCSGLTGTLRGSPNPTELQKPEQVSSNLVTNDNYDPQNHW